jgi:hypothetical protein
VLFPVVTPLLVRASSTIDGATLLAGYHTGYNIVGVLVLLPLIDRFTRLVERILPERGSPLTRCLDPSALASPIVAVEAVRRTIARALVAVCSSVEPTLAAASRGEPIRPGKDFISEAANALRQAQVFLSDVPGPPDSDDEQRRLTNTLHALDHASRLAETASGAIDFGTVRRCARRTAMCERNAKRSLGCGRSRGATRYHSIAAGDLARCRHHVRRSRGVDRGDSRSGQALCHGAAGTTPWLPEGNSGRGREWNVDC